MPIWGKREGDGSQRKKGGGCQSTQSGQRQYKKRMKLGEKREGWKPKGEKNLRFGVRKGGNSGGKRGCQDICVEKKRCAGKTILEKKRN